jgi:hypothetical protein
MPARIGERSLRRDRRQDAGTNESIGSCTKVTPQRPTGDLWFCQLEDFEQQRKSAMAHKAAIEEMA